MIRSLSSLRSRAVRRAADLIPSSILVRRGSGTRPEVALTFDDGPDGLTIPYLDALDRLRVRSTFFVIGRVCERHPRELLEIARRGHEIASHGHTHKLFPDLSGLHLRDELSRTAALLPRTDAGARLVRPPRGATSTTSLARCAMLGYRTVLWSLDSDDCRTRSADEVVAQCARAQAGDILLLHEAQTWTLEALPGIVGSLRARGLEPVTVSDLLS